MPPRSGGDGFASACAIFDNAKLFNKTNTLFK
jgi:hypothetical protein